MRSLAEGKYFKKLNAELCLEILCTYKADFVGVLKFVKQLFMNCKDYDGLLPFFFFPVIILPSALKRDPREFAESWQGSSYNAHNRRKMQAVRANVGHADQAEVLTPAKCQLSQPVLHN